MSPTPQQAAAGSPGRDGDGMGQPPASHRLGVKDSDPRTGAGLTEARHGDLPAQSKLHLSAWLLGCLVPRPRRLLTNHMQPHLQHNAWTDGGFRVLGERCGFLTAQGGMASPVGIPGRHRAMHENNRENMVYHTSP